MTGIPWMGLVMARPRKSRADHNAVPSEFPRQRAGFVLWSFLFCLVKGNFSLLLLLY